MQPPPQHFGMNLTAFARRAVLSLVVVLLSLTTLPAAPRPVRVLYFDPQGIEQTQVGPLHRAMEQLGPDAIFFDYFPGPQLPTVAELAHYDAILERADTAGPLRLPSTMKLTNKVLTTLPVQAGDAPAQIRAAVLGRLPAAAKAERAPQIPLHASPQEVEQAEALRPGRGCVPGLLHKLKK